MGARLVGASLLVYALAVTLFLFLLRQTDANAPGYAFGYGGLIAYLALAMLLAGAAMAREFGWSCLVITVVVVLALAVLPVIVASASGTSNYGLILLYDLLALAPFVVYPLAFAALASKAPELAGISVRAAAPFAVAVTLAFVLLGPHDAAASSPARTGIVSAVATSIATLGGATLLAGLVRTPPSYRLVRVMLWTVGIIQFAVFVRGVP